MSCVVTYMILVFPWMLADLQTQPYRIEASCTASSAYAVSQHGNTRMYGYYETCPGACPSVQSSPQTQAPAPQRICACTSELLSWQLFLLPCWPCMAKLEVWSCTPAGRHMYPRVHTNMFAPVTPDAITSPAAKSTPGWSSLQAGICACTSPSQCHMPTWHAHLLHLYSSAREEVAV
jgi:hypothetical protein